MYRVRDSFKATAPVRDNVSELETLIYEQNNGMTYAAVDFYPAYGLCADMDLGQPARDVAAHTEDR